MNNRDLILYFFYLRRIELCLVLVIRPTEVGLCGVDSILVGLKSPKEKVSESENVRKRMSESENGRK